MSHLLFPWKITHNHVHHSASPPCAFCSFLDLYLGLQKPGVQHLSFIGLPAAPLAAWSSVGPKFGTGNAFQKHCPNNQVPNTSTFCNHHYYHTSSISSDAGQGGENILEGWCPDVQEPILPPHYPNLHFQCHTVSPLVGRGALPLSSANSVTEVPSHILTSC